MPNTKSDTAANAVKAMLNAAKGDLRPPAFLSIRPEAMKFWAGITRARARDQWIEVDLVVAAQLADCQACIEEETIALRLEGTVIKNDRGTPVANPRATILERLASREMALMRTLRMGGQAAPGDAKTLTAGRKVEQQSRAARQQITDDELLAS